MPRLTPRFLVSSYYKNFPKAYIDKEKGVAPKKIFGNRFGGPDIVTYEVHPDDFIQEEDLPWSAESKRIHSMKKRELKRFQPQLQQWNHNPPKLTVEPQENWLLFVGDRVQVLVGKDRGKQGHICDMVRERNWCYVEGLNCKYETLDPPGFEKQIITVAQKLDMTTEVALVDPGDERITTAEWRWDELGQRVRVSRRTGRAIPIPLRESETFEYKTPETYIECSKDTTTKLVEKVTYTPELCTFEEDICREYGISDDRKFGKTFWY